MAYPDPLPTFSEDEFRDMWEKMEEFEISEERRQRVASLREKIRKD